MNNNKCSFIPHNFKLNKKVYNVIIDDDYLKNEKLWGEADFTNREVILCHKDYKKRVLTKEIKGKVFYHELVHQILEAMKRDDLNEDEDFVDEFGCFLYEYEKTKK